MQKTLVLLKPDTVQRKLIGEITQRLEHKGFKLVGMKMLQLNEALLKEHYAHLVEYDFFPSICEFMMSSPIVAQCWEGNNAVEVVRKLCGVTHGRDAAPGTIRGDYSLSQQRNIIHASDSEENAQKEIQRFFKKSEIFEYQKIIEKFSYATYEQ